MTEEQKESALMIAFANPVICEAMDSLKGTILYSNRVVKAMEEWMKLKVYRDKREYTNDALDQNLQGSNLVINCIKVGIKISEQPKHVQMCFNNEFESILVRYGINLNELV